MRYRDLIQFDPIESVIQLREADDKQEARHLVQTYVISDRMADLFVNLIFPQLQIDRPVDNKGVLIVGNYGTGKSHLMSVISALAEHGDLVELLANEPVQAAAQTIAGRFHVVRVEIGSVTRSLREILLEELEAMLAEWGVEFTFPTGDQISNNKDSLIAAVAAFRDKYPDQGILLVVDELLDYLRTREERDLILDLGFLRELGEVAALTSFRFLGGLQESLFDTPRFAFVAQPLNRVRDRFEQVRIAREDIAYVVAHRLLRKNDQQLAQITDHLRQFAPLYNRLAERLDEFARLFPIHPAYIETFERVYVAEKREVLKTFSLAIRGLLDKEVPTDQPGLISYDHYWNILRGNPSMRSMEGVAEVIDKSNILEGRIDHAYTKKHLLPVARRIIHALSVHRLTTDSIRTPVGATPEELRDDLCLYMRLPETTAEFLLSNIQVALREIMRTVSGQFLAHNEENGQYYLDVDKVIDFDAKIGERGASLGDDELNRYFFDALRQALNLSLTSYVTNFRIWFYELPWAERQVTRPGYLFFGLPDERSTAQPPRDFYVYVLPPFNPKAWEDKKLADEVIFQLTGLDQEFTETVRLYAGARALSLESADYRQTYGDKAEEQLRRLNRWLRQHLVSRLQVTYQGVTKPVGAILPATRSSASQSLDEFMQLIAAHLLAPDFAERYPDYPAFTRLNQPVTEQARANTAMEAVRFLAGRGRTNLAQAVLEGLKLVDEAGTIRLQASPYAQHCLTLLQNKADENQVVNRGELIATVAGGVEQPVEMDLRFKLEPEWVVVVLLALVQHGRIVLNIDGRTNLDAGSLEKAATISMADLTDFRYYKRPRTLPLDVWVDVFETLGLSTGLIRDENSRDEGVRNHLLPTLSRELERTATLQGQLQRGVQLWNTRLFTDLTTLQVQSSFVVGSDAEQPQVTLSTTDLIPHLRRYKEFLETLSRFNTVGKLRNLQMGLADVHHAKEDRRITDRAEQLLDLVHQMQPLTTYLAEAQASLPADHAWVERAAAARQHLINSVRRLGKGEDAPSPSSLLRELEALKADYIKAYAQLHRQMVLNAEGDARRRQLYDDPRLKALNQLAAIDLLSEAELRGWKEAIGHVPVSLDFHEGVLADSPIHDGFRPVQHRNQEFNAAEQIAYFDLMLDDMLLRWQQALRANLNSEATQQSLAAMTPEERKPIAQFLAQPDDDTRIPAGFAQAANHALHGIEAVSLPVEELVKALKQGGLPCTVAELEQR
ncbi:MAG: hypothetical protein KC441_16615, partial [Anaerolineales bacterium]|nr:hypothetical protein [Anaerolineales bacterium]